MQQESYPKTSKNDSDAPPPQWACPSNHISPPCRDWVLSASESGSAVQLIPTGIIHPSLKLPPRGPVTSFSARSRFRLMWLLANLQNDAFRGSLFVTLTYPRSEPQLRKVKEHLDSFTKRIARKFPNAAAIWKMEYTNAGTPHFHLLLFGVPFWHKSDVARCWAEIVKSNHPSHRAAGTRVERLESKRHAIRYVSKYIAKLESIPPEHKGRIWGKMASLCNFMSPTRIFTIKTPEAMMLRRILDKIRKANSRRKSFKRRANCSNSQRWFTTTSRLQAWLAALEGVVVVGAG